MSDSNILPLFKIAGIHSSLKSVNYCFKRTSFWKQKCKWKYKVIKIVLCLFLWFTCGLSVKFLVFLLRQVSRESPFFVLSPVAVPTWEMCRCGTRPPPGHPWPLREAPPCPLSCYWVRRGMGPPCLPADVRALVWAAASLYQTRWLASCPPLVALLAGSKREDWESRPVISRVWNLAWK